MNVSSVLGLVVLRAVGQIRCSTGGLHLEGKCSPREERSLWVLAVYRTDVKDVFSKSKDDEMALCVVQLLMAHFGENLTGQVFCTDVCATEADTETTLTVPASPRLILLVSGGTWQVTIKHWMITLEGCVISEGITPNFLMGLAAVFAIYYMLNLQYQEEAACTLEFIQRVGIPQEMPCSQVVMNIRIVEALAAVWLVSALINLTINGVIKSSVLKVQRLSPLLRP
ncbi:hypothetical protein QQF64_015836 [Cirrhinus molitorella]|uniref:Uncharacterized protein n=1 Tax=Cirrhinus molitorella TaxID=172907 RepID=A0ABR3LL33_9TELE